MKTGLRFVPLPLPPSDLQPEDTLSLIHIYPKKITGTAERLLEIPAVTDVYSISGRYDLLVIIKCESNDMIECVITDHLLKTEGITNSETMFAFRSYDKREGGRAIDVD